MLVQAWRTTSSTRFSPPIFCVARPMAASKVAFAYFHLQAPPCCTIPFRYCWAKRPFLPAPPSGRAGVLRLTFKLTHQRRATASQPQHTNSSRVLSNSSFHDGLPKSSLSSMLGWNGSHDALGGRCNGLVPRTSSVTLWQWRVLL